jgi:hypothetical protein
MNRLAVLVALAVCLPLTARADEASQRAKAQELATLMHTDRMVQQVSANFMKQLAAAGERLIGPSATPESKQKLVDLEKKFSDLIDSQVGWKVIEPAFTDIYAKTFTEDELNAIVAFYKTSGGTALIDKMPSVNSQATMLMQSKMTALQPQMKQMYEEFQRSQVAPPPAGSPATPPTLAPATPAPATPSPK